MNASLGAFKSVLSARSRKLGFHAFGVAAASTLEVEREQLHEWLRRGYHGTMRYMANLERERTDLSRLLDGVKSVLCFAHNYYHPDPIQSTGARIARYARGRDYHRVLRKKLKEIAGLITARFPDAATRVCVDTAPVLEKAWAERAGLGWRGKHTNLVTRARGSWTFLGEVLTTLELPPDERHLDFCGDCRRCLDACPTGAFPEPYALDARRCISYLTIEHRGAFSEEEGGLIGDHLFGCDICLEVCPWNRFRSVTKEPDFAPRETIMTMSPKAWSELGDDEADQLLSGSAMRRAGFAGLRRNADAVLRREGGHKAPDGQNGP